MEYASEVCGCVIRPVVHLFLSVSTSATNRLYINRIGKQEESVISLKKHY